MNENSAVVRIEKLYPENGFRLFREYCENCGIIDTRDLNGFDFGEIKFRGIGVGKLHQIRERYEEYLDEKWCPDSEEYKNDGLNLTEIVTLSSIRELDPEIGSILIDDVFNDNAFRFFRDYCMKKELKTLDQLVGFNFDSILDLRWVGIKKIQKIKTRFLEVIEGGYTSYKEDDIVEDESLEIHADFKDLPVHLYFGERVTQNLSTKGIRKMRDLTTSNVHELQELWGVGKSKFNRMADDLEEFRGSLENYILRTFEVMKSLDDYQIFWLRNFEKRTLESISNMPEFKVTRERIRQKESKFLKLASIRFRIIEDVICRKDLKSIAVIQPDRLIEWMNTPENAMIFKIFIKEGQLRRFKYSKPLDLILVDIEPEEIENKLRMIIEKKGDIFDLTDDIESITNDLESHDIAILTERELESFLISEGYYRYNGLFSRSRLSIGSMAEILVKQHFPEGITRGDDVLKLNLLLQKEFGVLDYGPDDERALWATFADRDNSIIQWGQSSRIHIDNVFLEPALIDKIKRKIDKHLSQSDFLSTSKLFDDLSKDIRSNSNIKSFHGLYGVIKYYFSDLYDLNRYTIRRIDRIEQSIQNALENFVIERNGKVTLAEVKNRFKCSDVMISTTISINNVLLLWSEGNEIIHASKLTVPDNQKNILEDALYNSFDDDGYSNAMMVRAIVPGVFKSIGATDSVSVYSLLQYLFGDKYYFYRRPTILRDKSVYYRRMEDLLIREFQRNVVTELDDLREKVIRKYKWEEWRFYSTVAKIKNNLLQLDKNIYCLFDTIEVDENLIRALRSAVGDCLESKPYVTTDDIAEQYLAGYHVVVQGHKFPVNYLIVKDLVQKYCNDEFRVITRFAYNYRYDKAIIVDVTSSFKGLGDLICYILLDDGGSRKWTISSAELHLRNKRIIAGRIPDEFLSMSNVIIHEEGTLEILEDINEGREQNVV